ncbi:hypothetical protein PGO_145950 [Plasmodium gonderi]|uniref:Dolichyl-diphosphooligosaccharide-protein glycosyltransferase subunit OST5 n=1 Tax=Plasmodium gonderi TaxID=77519 RepID=A0A1Y1JRF1_PLAGO|nr:hypothetical protein PGO_145950 [Plasmodium gonderi]GAW83797.1 hypothetical protein PGO_145950 [Plasmodium gonderi]
MVTASNVKIELEPYNSILKRKYIPYLLFIFHISAFISIIFLLDYLCENRNKRSLKVSFFLCLITSFTVGLSIYFLLLYFNICL